MDEVEGRVLAWLRDRHGLLQERGSVTALLKECIEMKTGAASETLRLLLEDLAEALDHLERILAGF